jgi:hypothetical protein
MVKKAAPKIPGPQGFCLTGHGYKTPQNRLGFVAQLRSTNPHQHGQAAGNQNEGHDQCIEDAGKFKRVGPVGSGVPQVSVAVQHGSKRNRVRNDE